jgi:hypothetical protein
LAGIGSYGGENKSEKKEMTCNIITEEKLMKVQYEIFVLPHQRRNKNLYKRIGVQLKLQCLYPKRYGQVEPVS